MSTTLKTVREKVMTKISIAPDLQLHIKITKADGLELVNLRQFIPSLKKYGRGVAFESHLLPQVVEGLLDLKGHVSGFDFPSSPGEGQGSLFG